MKVAFASLGLCLLACGADEAPPGGRPDSGALPRDSGVMLDAGIAGDAGVMDAGIPPAPPAPALGAQLDRVGRPAINRLLVATFEDEPVRGPAKDAYNQTEPGGWPIAKIPLAESLAVFDAVDGRCGNQLLADPFEIPERYFALADILADDRLYLNAASQDCRQFLAVELAATGTEPIFLLDCGGRAPSYDVMDGLYSIFAIGSWTGVGDGLAADEAPITSVFPFLAPPDP